MLEYLNKHLQTRWAGRGEIAYEPVMNSTNIRAKEMARNGAPHGSLAVCDHQTAGRGRMTRRWETPAGEALTQTMVLRPKLPIEQAQLCTFAAALAAAKAVEEVCPELKPGIKWPNDVVIGGKKCVGILCEMVLDGKGYAVVPGVGINVNQKRFDGELSDKATSLLMETGRPVERREVLCAYLKHMEEAIDALEKNGLDGIVEEYLRRSVTLGSRVRVVGTATEFIGTAKAVEMGNTEGAMSSGCDRRADRDG